MSKFDCLKFDHHIYSLLYLSKIYLSQFHGNVEVLFRKNAKIGANAVKKP